MKKVLYAVLVGFGITTFLLALWKYLNPEFNPLWIEVCFSLWLLFEVYSLYSEYAEARQHAPRSRDTQVKLVWFRSSILMAVVFIALVIFIGKDIYVKNNWIIPIIVSFLFFYFSILIQSVLAIYKNNFCK
jgi:uncharacterized membrane protein